jgi:hypothetical protein
LVLLVGVAIGAKAQYAVGDYGSWVSGNWGTTGTWRVWDGAAWNPAPGIPGPTHRVHIRSGHTVNLNISGQTVIIWDLIVEAGAKLWTQNFTTNRYITLRGTELRCDGQIGDGANFDGISFNFDGVATLLHGSGTFDASRLRKFSSANAVPMFSYETTLTIAMDIRLRFNTASTTQIYNNQDNTCIFNVIVQAGRTVELTGAVGSGNIAIDGIDGQSNHARGGTFTINGTLLIPGTLYLRSNNVLGAPKCRVIINAGGYVRTNTVEASASGTAVHDFIVNNGGVFEIDGMPAWTGYSTVNNTYTFGATSRTVYSGMGAQDIPAVPGGYGHLRIRGDGLKQLLGDTDVRGDLEILGTDGAPELDVTTANRTLNVRGNWTSYGEAGFTERSGLVIFSEGLPQAIATTGGERFHNWRIERTGALYVTMNSDVTVVNNLDLPAGTGRLDLNGRTLALLNPSPAAITGAFATARHIRSENTAHASRVRWHIGATAGAHFIPFGTSSGLRLFNFNLTAGNAGIVTVSTYGTPPSNLPWPTTPTLVTNLNSTTGLLPDNRDATVDRFWEVTVTGTPTAALTFSYTAVELPPSPFNTPLAMNAQRWDPALQKWLPATAGQSSIAYAVTAPGLTQFGAFALAATLSPLPIELIAFDATPRGDVVDLWWSTASEKDNERFTILRSADGERFTELFSVPGMGNSVVRTDYTAVDDAPLDGVSYYKLRQTDFDGTWTESHTVAVVRDRARGSLLAWPNPAADHLWLEGVGEGTAVVRVFDALGRQVMSTVLPATEGPRRIGLDGLAQGRYTLVLECEGTTPAVLAFVRS